MAGMAPGKGVNSIHEAVLVRWNDAGPHPQGRTEDNSQVFGLAPVPSDGGYGFVKNVYPWRTQYSYQTLCRLA